MKKDNIILPLDLYYLNLTEINGVKFTPRELDVISCILNGRTAAIADFLLIGKRAVEGYISDIRKKAGGLTGRDQIIDFIEKSGKLSLIKNEYYSALRLRILFEEKLKEVVKKIDPHSSSCLLVYEKSQKYPEYLIPYLKDHLKRIGFGIKTYPHEGNTTADQSKVNFTEYSSILYVMPEKVSSSCFMQDNTSHLSHVVFLSQQEFTLGDVYKKLKDVCYVDMFKEGNYYFSFFEILKKLLPHSKFDKIIEDFKQQCNSINESSINPTPRVDLATDKEFPWVAGKLSVLKKPLAYFSALFIVATITLSFLFFAFKGESRVGRSPLYSPSNQSGSLIRSDLILPSESTLLYRPDLIAQIEDKFKKQGGGIQTLALVGIGGAGKTTLARQYAHKQKANVVWEINAETNSTLMESFEKLAEALAKTDQDQKLLRALEEIKDASKREEKLINFVKERLKLKAPWVLMYDNLEDVADGQKYFPLDSETWGQGRVILTTRDSTIQNNKQVSHVVNAGELDKAQKLSLFTQIMGSGRTHTNEAISFLERIPPFPLDVSVAAYYLKTTNTPYATYLEQLDKLDNNFEAVQESLLKGAGDYVKTRRKIITVSLREIMKSDNNFSDLLLFISFLDSQHIPRDLLTIFKNNTIVDNFIYQLKKHSLISSDSSSATGPTFSMHRSIQDMTWAYLKNFLNLETNDSLIKSIAYALDDYTDRAIEQEDFLRMRVMMRHIEKFLNYQEILTDFQKGLLKSKLGCTYYFTNSEKSRKVLEDSLNLLSKKKSDYFSPDDNLKLARSFLHIGVVYTELRFYTEAEELFNKAISIYKQEGIRNYAELSWVLSHLGNIHRRMGSYDKARGYLEQSIQLNKEHKGDKKRTAHTLGYLGSVYRGLGFYQKAIDALEESLAIYNQSYTNDHFRNGWTLTRLGNVYSDLGDFEKAKDCFEQGLLVSRKYFPEDHMSMALTLTYLGNCYRELGEYEKSRNVLEESLNVHEKYFDKKYRRMGWVLFHLASTYQALGGQKEAHQLYDKVLEIYANYCHEEDIETAGILRNMARICLSKNRLNEAEDYIKKSLARLQSRHHVDAYRSLEVLGEIYLKKASGPENQNLKMQALNLFNQALEIAEPNFPQHSFHIKRIKYKISKIK